MAHFAEVKDGIVQRVIVISDRDAPNPAPDSSEPLGQAFINNTLKLPGEWIQTSYNNNFRAHYAGIGYIWDSENEVFYSPQPYPSWTLDAQWNWQPPVPYPEASGDEIYIWQEDTLEWVEVN